MCVLDLAEGSERYTLELAGSGHNVTLVDLSNSNVEQARKEAEKEALYGLNASSGMPGRSSNWSKQRRCCRPQVSSLQHLFPYMRLCGLWRRVARKGLLENFFRIHGSKGLKFETPQKIDLG